jgi:hypothetical protein
MNWNALAAPFPRNSVSWRAQSMNKDCTKAMALAYIDARDVMDRLDLVCGPGNWSDAYVETVKGRVICTLSIRVNGEWIAKTDGAGDTDVEGEKGAISDALKRAAVKWGIGRYLYAMPAPWVPCETYERNGKKFWSKWSDDPWSYVRNEPTPLHITDDAKRDAEAAAEENNAAMIVRELEACQSQQSLMDIWNRCNFDKTLKPLLLRSDVVKAKDAAKARLMGDDPFSGKAA